MSSLLETQTKDSYLKITVDAERVVGDNVALIKDGIDDLIKEHDGATYFIDFKNAQYMDNAAVGMLLRFYKHIPNAGRNLNLGVPSTPLYNLFALLHLHHLFNIYQNEEKFQAKDVSRENPPSL